MCGCFLGRRPHVRRLIWIFTLYYKRCYCLDIQMQDKLKQRINSNDMVGRKKRNGKIRLELSRNCYIPTSFIGLVSLKTDIDISINKPSTCEQRPHTLVFQKSICVLPTNIFYLHLVLHVIKYN